MKMKSFLRFGLFAMIFSSIIGLIIATFNTLFTQSMPSSNTQLIMAFGLGSLSLWVFLSTGDDNRPKKV